MNNNPLVSIIIATYNRVDAVSKSIESVLNQSYKELEIIVVDDGSSDNTSKILKEKFGEKIVLNILEKNQGATFARNTGLKMAKGEYSIVWDSDDVLYPNAIEVLIEKAKEFPDTLTISAPTNVFRNEQKIEFKKIPEGFISLETMICANMPKFKLVRMSKTSAHQEKQILYRGKNLDFMINNELCSAGGWFHVDQELGDHFLFSDKNSLTIKRKKLNINSSINRADFISEHLNRFKDVYLKKCPRRYSDYAYGATLGFILKGDLKRARELASDSWSAYKNIRNFVLWILTKIPFSSPILKFLYKILS